MVNAAAKGEMDMKLYTRAQNSAGERVRIALNLKGIAHEYVAVSTLGPGEYARINPQELLPALEIDGRIITQSAAILNYLEAVFPERPLLPADPVVRAQAIAFGSVVAAEMHAVTVQRVRRFLASNMGADDARVQQWVAHWLGLGFATLEGLLAARPADWPFCFGDEPGWADLFLVPQVSNGRRLGIDLGDCPRVTEIADRCRGLEPFRLAEPQMQPDYAGASS